MFLGTLDKQPREALPVDISYDRYLGTSSADNILLTIETPAGMTLQTSAASALEKRARLYVSGGADGQSYSWTVLADISIGGQVTRVEDEFVVAVREVVPAAAAAAANGLPASTFTLEQYRAIVAAIASGEMVVAYNGKRVEYRSMGELMQAKSVIEADLVAAGVLPAPGSASGVRRGSTTLASYCGD